MHLELKLLDVLSEIYDGILLHTILALLLGKLQNLRFLLFQKHIKISNLFLIICLDGLNDVLLEFLEILSELNKMYFEFVRHGV